MKQFACTYPKVRASIVEESTFIQCSKTTVTDEDAYSQAEARAVLALEVGETWTYHFPNGTKHTVTRIADYNQE